VSHKYVYVKSGQSRIKEFLSAAGIHGSNLGVVITIETLRAGASCNCHQFLRGALNILQFNRLEVIKFTIFNVSSNFIQSAFGILLQQGLDGDWCTGY
jgi:hypothetical protein